MTTQADELPAGPDWNGARGEKWRAQLSGMEAMLRPVDQPLTQALKLDTALRIADVGCGGGGTTFEILRLAPPGSAVHGFDISAALIEVARARARAVQASIEFQQADVSTTQPPVLYDRLVSRFGIMFFDHPQAAFANLARWLAPHGRFAFAVWGRMEENPWMTTVRDVVARIVAIPPAGPDAPGAFRYAEADGLLELLGSAGFSELELRDWRGALPIGGGLPPADAARFALAAFASFGELLAAEGDAAVADAERALSERFSHHQHAVITQMDACVHLVTGTRR